MSYRLFTVAGMATAAAAALLALGVAAGAQDQSTGEADDGVSGALIDIAGDGADVKAAGASVTVTGDVGAVQAAGATVTVKGTASGDVQLAGAQVRFDGQAARELSVAGASIEVRGQVGRNLNVGGAATLVNAVVGGDLNVGSATLTIGPGTDIAGELKAGAATMTVSGHVAGKANLAGALVTINARTDGDVEVRAAQVVVSPSARIGGNLTVYSLNEPMIAEGAVVTGTVSRISPPDWWQRPSWSWLLGFAAYVAAGTVLAGIVLMLFGGQVFTAATEHVRHRPLSSFLFGVLTLVLVPFVAVVLFATLIGISTGFAVLLLLPFLTVFGHAVAAAGIASAILVRRAGQIGIGLALIMLIVGAILLVAIGLIPFVGWALVTIAVVLGVGAFTRTVGARLRRPTDTPAAVVIP